MPIYEFTCQKCGKQFDKLCPIHFNEKDLICPECGAKDCKREVSLFGYKGTDGGGSVSSSGCGSCSSTNCGSCGH